MEFEPGDVTIDLSKRDLIRNLTFQTLMIITPASTWAESTCTGDIINLSDPDERQYKDCQALSESSNKCVSAFMLD